MGGQYDLFRTGVYKMGPVVSTGVFVSVGYVVSKTIPCAVMMDSLTLPGCFLHPSLTLSNIDSKVVTTFLPERTVGVKIVS